VDPNERYKTEMQKQYTDKNISRLLLKAAGNISDELALRDKDYMDYTATLNAHDSNQVRDFVKKTNTEPLMSPPRHEFTLPTQENLLGTHTPSILLSSIK
jgi:hypothetical protein